MLLKRFLPLGAFLILVLLLVRGLALDPTELPSARLGKNIPSFNLPVLDTTDMRSAEGLAGQTRINKCLGYMVFFLSR